MRRGAKPSKARVESKLPVAPKSRKNEGSRVRDLEKRLAEALDQQTATTEILGVISSSPANAQPVFDAIAVNALRLCDAKGAVVVRYDGALLHVAAYHNVNREAVDRLQRQARRLPSGSGTGPRSRYHFSAKACRSGPSSFDARRYGSSRTRRSRCCRPSPTRR